MINFKAKYNSNGTIKRLNKKQNYDNIPAYFVELNVNSKKDLNALKKVADNWKGNIYATDVYERLKFYHYNNSNASALEERFFALTTQRNNFNKLNFKKILGVVEIFLPLGEDPEIEFLQTNPKFLKKNPKIKHIGKTIVDNIKKILKDETIALYSTYNAIPFYEKQGFKIIEDNLMKLIR